MLKQIKARKGIAPLASVILGISILSIIALMTTNWVLSFKNNDSVKSTLEGKTIAMNKWDEIIHQNLNEKEENTNKVVTTTDETGHTITVSYGAQGAFKKGKCDSSLSQDDINNSYQKCTNVTVNVKDKNGNDMYTMQSINVLSSTYIYPIGTIIPYTGEIKNIPSNWRLCDGTNGTPDLNNKYLKGTNEQNKIGITGGNNEFKILSKNLPDTEFHINSPTPIILGASISSYTSGIKWSAEAEIPNPVATVIFCGYNDALSLTMHDLATYIYIPDWKGKPLPIAPLHQTVAYIIKVN